MDEKPFYLKVLFGAEVVLAARVLLFVIPVFIYEFSNKLSAPSTSEWFMLSYAIPAVFYLIVGVTCLLGNRQWRILHYVTTVITAIFTAMFVRMVVQTEQDLRLSYFVPTVVALMIIWIISLRKKNFVEMRP